jgi:hypothetical protein
MEGGCGVAHPTMQVMAGGSRELEAWSWELGAKSSELGSPPSTTPLESLMRTLIVMFVVAAGCTASKDERAASTQRERDSVIGASKLPGAGGVRGALRAADSAAARNARRDSAGTDPR